MITYMGTHAPVSCRLLHPLLLLEIPGLSRGNLDHAILYQKYAEHTRIKSEKPTR